MKLAVLAWPFLKSSMMQIALNKPEPWVMQIFNSSPIRVLGCVPWSIDLIATRAVDMAKHLNAEIVNEGEISTRRIKASLSVHVLYRMIEALQEPGSC